MRKIRFFSLVIILLLIAISCQNESPDIKDYSEKLQIEFPEGMDLIFFKKESDFQDYSVSSVYKLSFNQKNAMLDQIIKNSSDESKHRKTYSTNWYKCDDFYSYEYSNKNEGFTINIIFIASNNFSTLSIYEVKI